MDYIVKWDITNKCNMRCPYCLRAAERHGATDLELEEIKRCVEVLARFARKISLLGGEPTCLRELPDIIKYIRERGLGVEIVTNGLKIDHLTKVLHLVDRVVISIDGPDPKTYGVLRNERFFDIVLNNARALASCVPVDINCVVHKGNFHKLHQMLDLACDTGAQGINFLQFIDPGIPQAKNLTLAPHEEIQAVISLGEGIKKCGEKAKYLTINARFVYPLVVDYINKANDFTIPIPTHMCGAGLTFLYVNQRGELFPCDRIATSWSPTTKSSLLKCNIEEIITNELFHKALSFQAKSDTYDSWVPCKWCPYLRKICFPCPVVTNGLAEGTVVATCYMIENLLEVEVLPHILYVAPDKSQGIVFNPLHGPPLELNKTAIEILERLRAHSSVKIVLEKLAKEYNKEVREISEDVFQTISTLCKSGIVRYRRILLDQAALS